MADGTMKELEAAPYVEWLENALREIVAEEPTAISIETMDAEGNVATRYYNVDRVTRSGMMLAMSDAQMMELIEDYKEEIASLLFDDDEPGSEDGD